MNEAILKEINSKKNNARINILSRFFKTGPRQYGEGDIFLGLTVPLCRKISKKYENISLREIGSLLSNKIHEVRLVALFILIAQYQKSKEKDKKTIIDFYLKNIKYVNNWDLVDLSSYKLLGDYLLDKKDKSILLKFARSKNLWEQRISIIATFAFIKNGDSEWTLKIAKMFIQHEHDLIHKATGWMLREVGKRVSVKDLCQFLEFNIKKMPRTMLRYSIEKFPKEIRLEYLKK
jgi:3-methyladenine DNA glycosylase AlkD